MRISTLAVRISLAAILGGACFVLSTVGQAKQNVGPQSTSSANAPSIQNSRVNRQQTTGSLEAQLKDWTAQVTTPQWLGYSVPEIAGKRGICCSGGDWNGDCGTCRLENGEHGVKVRYLHSDIDTVERVEIIRDLRKGLFDVLVGINLLREGLDIPEVSLVAILDADKEGFLRGETSLVQTIGRAARNVNGRVVMYADKETDAMRAAMRETDRRRAIQIAYNEEHGITPTTVRKGISEMSELLAMEDRAPAKRRRKRTERWDSPEELEKTIVSLEEEMLMAADDLRFEEAGRIRDELRELRRDLEGMTAGA